MPMPHRTFAAMAKRRLIGKEGSARTREIRALLVIALDIWVIWAVTRPGVLDR